MLKNIFDKVLKLKKSRKWYMPDKKGQQCYMPDKCIIVEHIIRPQISKARLFKFRTDIVIKGPTMTFYY